MGIVQGVTSFVKKEPVKRDSGKKKKISNMGKGYGNVKTGELAQPGCIFPLLPRVFLLMVCFPTCVLMMYVVSF